MCIGGTKYMLIKVYLSVWMNRELKYICFCFKLVKFQDGLQNAISNEFVYYIHIFYVPGLIGGTKYAN